MRWPAARSIVLAALAACTGQTGTIQLTLVTAPNSTLLDGIQHLRVTLTNPPQVVEADRGDAGFNLALDVEATGEPGSLIVEGFDGGGSLIGTGASPPFAVSAIDARIVVYLAKPLSIEPAPSSLPAARIGVASTALPFGFAVAGGEDAAAVRTDSLLVYNIFDHSLVAGLPMPAPKSFQTIATGSGGRVYLFGGIGSDGAPTGSVWRFDTTAKPNGSYAVLEDHVELARAGESAVTLSPENTIITGTPPIDLDFGVPVARTDLPALSSAGAAGSSDSIARALFAGDPIVRLTGDEFDTIPLAADPTSSATALPDGRIVFAGGATTDVLAVVAADGSSTRTAALSVPRAHAAVAATARHLIVAGGDDDSGDPIATADVLDATSLALIATLPCVARSGATALAMPNGQIAIIGGEPANDAIELFTPPPP